MDTLSTVQSEKPQSQGPLPVNVEGMRPLLDVRQQLKAVKHVFSHLWGALANHESDANKNVTQKQFNEQNNGSAHAFRTLIHI